MLVAFDALMSERSVTKASRRIGRTQPAMSVFATDFGADGRTSSRTDDLVHDHL